MTRIAAGGTACEMQGRGPAVVLVHGMCLNRAMWQWLVPALTPRFQIVTYDFLGHGESADPGARVAILPGLRHMALAEDPAAFNAPLVSFLTEALVARSG